MRLKAAVEGSLSEYMEREYQNCARAVTKGVSLAANGLKTAMRTQVKSAGLGSKLANTWRGDVYPKAKNSVSAAGVVYTKAQKIMEGFEYQTVVRGKDGLWLAIPTAAISKRIRNKRMMPALYERSKVFVCGSCIGKTARRFWCMSKKGKQLSLLFSCLRLECPN